LIYQRLAAILASAQQICAAKKTFAAAAGHLPRRRETMSVAKISEITSSSSKSFEDAVRKGISKISKTVDNVEGAWVKEQKVVVENGEVTAYRVTMKVTFVVK
jgi:flavin-binding protein dodecin